MNATWMILGYSCIFMSFVTCKSQTKLFCLGFPGFDEPKQKPQRHPDLAAIQRSVFGGPSAKGNHGYLRSPEGVPGSNGMGVKWGFSMGRLVDMFLRFLINMLLLFMMFNGIKGYIMMVYNMCFYIFFLLVKRREDDVI